MGLVRNAAGLLRKSAGFIKTCCCKKWLCDPFTQICTEDPSGTYTSEKQCNENCQRYDCDSNTGQCVATPTGPYANLAECLAACEKKYKCDTNNYNCTEDPLGPYATLKECEDNCKEPKHYCCGSPGNPDDRDCYDEPCEDLGLDEFGVYDTPEECADKCKAPHYACDPTTYTCYETPTGGYTDINLCNAECKPRYTCRTSDYTCIPDPNGPYESMAECEQYCKDTKYYCCGSPGNPDDRDCYGQPCSELGLDDFGEYETQEKCDEACKIDHYCCEDSEGNRFCSEDCEFDGANTVGGPYPSAEECDKACNPPKTYACREKSDGSKECVEDVFGTYDDDTCGGECEPPKKYTCFVRDDGSKVCVEKGDGEYDDDTCGGECEKAKYSCRDNGDGTSTCVEDPNGGYDDADCGGECEKPKKYSCQNGDCVEDPNGAYDENTCGGECDKRYDCLPQPDGSIACVENIGGAFTEPTCGGGCDCNCVAGGTYFDTAKIDIGACGVQDQYFIESRVLSAAWAGAGKLRVVWRDELTGFSYSADPNACNIGFCVTTTGASYDSVFEYDCATASWSRISQEQVGYGTSSGGACNVFPPAAPYLPPLPNAGPTCITRAPNPLP